MPSARRPSTSTVEPISAALAGGDEAGDARRGARRGSARASARSSGWPSASAAVAAEDRLGAGVPEDDPAARRRRRRSPSRVEPVTARKRSSAARSSSSPCLRAVMSLPREEDELVGARVARAEHEPAVGRRRAARRRSSVSGAVAGAARRAPRARTAWMRGEVVGMDELVVGARRASSSRGPAEQRLPRGVRPREAPVGVGRAEQVVRHRREPLGERVAAGERDRAGGRCGGGGRRHRQGSGGGTGAAPASPMDRQRPAGLDRLRPLS